jgi:putative endopeptidase
VIDAMRLLFSLALLVMAPANAYDPTLLAPETSACDDFYSHANGRWLVSTPVPTGLQSLGLPELLSERSRNDRRTLLEAVARAANDPIDVALGTLWAGALDEAVIARSADAALAPWFKRIDAASKPREVVELLGAAHAAGLPLLFRLSVAIDSDQPDRRIAYALQGGLGLPERDYYLRHESGTIAVRDAYARYVESLLAASGDAEATLNASRVVELETRLARASQSLAQLRDPANSRRLNRIRELDNRYPNLEWKRYLRVQGLERLELLSLAHIAFFTEANALLTLLPIEHWRAYLRFHLIHQLAAHLDSGIRQANFELFGRVLAGQQHLAQRWEQALATSEALLGPELGLRYSETRFEPARQAAATQLFDALRAAQRRRIENVDWLQPSARSAALAKLDALRIEIARPPSAKRALPPLRVDDPIGNLLSLLALKRSQELHSIGPLTELAEPLPPLAEPWLAYHPQRNRLQLSPALLQAPLFEPAGDVAANFGALGTLLAHELSHAFDRIGAQYDASGKVAPWWGEAETLAHESRATAMAAQFDAYLAVGEVPVDGRLTLDENFADLAGLEIAFEAFTSVAGADPPDAEGRTSAQRFFLSFAQAGRRAVRDEVLRLTLASELHAPPRWRINGPLANHPAFAAAFSCSPGSGLMRASDEQLAIWR